MVDLKLMEHLESYLTENRKERFYKVLLQRTKHFTVAIEDVYQLHNTSAVLRSCDVFGIQNVHIIEEQNSKRIDREIAMGAQKWVDLIRYDSTEDCIESIKEKALVRINIMRRFEFQLDGKSLEKNIYLFY